MKITFLLTLAMAAAWPLASHGQSEKWTEEDWQPLIDEPSRGELLRMNTPFSFDIFALPRQFVFPTDTIQSGDPQFYGLDISHHQPSDLDFASFASKNIRYVFMKATQGVTHKDGKFGHFWKSLGALPAEQKVLRGAYHFLSAASTSDPETQAERFIAYINLHGGLNADDLAPVMDLEWDKGSGTKDRWSAYTPQQIVDRALRFLKRVEALTGRVPMIYTARSWWRERGIPEADILKFSRYKLWIADYSNATLQSEDPRGPHNVIPHLWQFTDRAKILGEGNAEFDGNVFHGSEDEFKAIFMN